MLYNVYDSQPPPTGGSTFSTLSLHVQCGINIRKLIWFPCITLRGILMPCLTQAQIMVQVTVWRGYGGGIWCVRKLHDLKGLMID